VTVLVVSCGGTISSVPSAGGATPALGAAELAAGLGVEAITHTTVPSAHGTLADVVALHHLLAGRDVDGVVVSQGTDTIEEVAFALDLLWDSDVPLVVTGAMRHAGLPGADGPGNLAAAVAVAASPQARGLGVIVVAADEIHAARLVRKTHTTSPATYRSPSAGPVGYVVEGRARILLRPPRRPVLPPADPAPVALLTAVLGDDGRLLGHIVDSEYRGLVVEAFGGGHLPPSWLPVLDAVVARIPVVLASRTGAGDVLRSTYAFPGAETDLLTRGLVPAGLLDGPKACVLLALTLGAGAPVGPTFAAHA
jgi:L-asparaginase